MPSGSTRARSAAPARASWCRSAIEERFIAKLKTRMSTLRVGDPLDKSIDIGALVAPVQVERVRDLMKAAPPKAASSIEPDGDMPEEGCFLKPDAGHRRLARQYRWPAEEIFGPVLVAMSFRTPEEAVALANNTKYGLAATIWSENINLALDIAPKIKAGVVWINGTNNFDAAVGFGGYKESGFGREGGKEGMGAYLKPAWEKEAQSRSRAIKLPDRSGKPLDHHRHRPDRQDVYRRQAGPPGLRLFPPGHSAPTASISAKSATATARTSATPSKRPAARWAGATTAAHTRAQILYFLAENLDYRDAEFAARIRAQTGGGRRRKARSRPVGRAPVRLRRLGRQIRWRRAQPAGPHDGRRHGRAASASWASSRPPKARCWAPSRCSPRRSPWATRWCWSLRAPPAGHDRFLPGDRNLRRALGRHQHRHRRCHRPWPRPWPNTTASTASGLPARRRHRRWSRGASAGNVKQTWTTRGLAYDWSDPVHGRRLLLGKATQIKNIWVPYGA